MRDYRAEYRTGADLQPIPDDLFMRTKTRIRGEQSAHSSKTRWSVLVPLCAVLALASVSAVAYGVYYFTQPVYQPRINSSIPAAVTKNAGAVVGKTNTASGLSVTINRTVCDNKSMYLSLNVQSKDGKPLQESSEFRKSQIVRERFAKCALNVGGKDYECWMFRTDNAAVPDKASYEIEASGDFSGQNGKPVTLTLQDFTDEVDTCEDAGFLFRNLGELYAKMAPEKPQNFIRTGIFIQYADQSIIPSWTIPAGKQKIQFSSQFPGAYIDNIGFHQTGESQKDMLYISITPGSQSEAAALNKLCFQNLDTMDPVSFDEIEVMGNGTVTGYSSREDYLKKTKADRDPKRAYNGKRVVIALAAQDEAGFNQKSCTVTDLSHYRLVKNFNVENIVRYSGTWKIPFTLQFNDTTRSFALNRSFKTSGGHSVIIRKLSLSDLSLSFSGKLKDYKNSAGSLKSDLSPNHIKLILKNGSAVDVGQKLGGGIDADGSFAFEGNLKSLVDAGQVAAIDLWGARIPLQP